MTGAEEREASRSELEQQLELTWELAFGMSELDTVDLALSHVLEQICRATEWNIGQAWLPGADATLRCTVNWHEPSLASFATDSEGLAFPPGQGLPGWTWSAGRPAWIPDLQADSRFLRGHAAAKAGLTAGMTLPVMAEGQPVAVLEFFVRERREEDARLVKLISAVAAQLGSFIRRKQAEEGLRESEAGFRSVLETAQDAVISIDSTGKVIYFNKSAERTFGHPREEAVGASLAMLVPAPLRPSIVDLLQRATGTDWDPTGGHPVELTGERSDGTTFPLELSVARWMRGHEKFFTGVIRDISARKRAQAEVEAREAQLSEAQSLARLGSFDWHVARGAATWSAELYRICGVDPLDFEPSSERIVALLHPDEVSQVTKEALAVLRDRRLVQFQHRIVRPDGEIRLLESRLEGVAGAGGRTVRVIGTCRDITEQRLEADERRQAEQRLQLAFANAPIGIALVAPDGCLLEVNRAMCEILGTSEETLIGGSFERFTHPDEIEKDRELLRRMVDGELKTIGLETRYIAADGETIFVRATASMVCEPDGSPLYVIAQIEDVTEQGRTERALHESREQLQTLLDNLTAAVFLKDLEGRYVLVNRESAAVAGRPANEVIGRTDAELFPPQVADRIRAHDKRALESDGPIEYEERLELADGVHSFLSQKFILRHGDGLPYAIGGIATDITERVRVGEENRRLENQVHRFERLDSIGRLAGGIAHDFNNLLAIILNYAALAADELAPESSAQRDLGEIQKAAKRAASLTGQLLAFSRRERIEAKALYVDKLVSDAGPLLRSTLGENIELVLSAAPELWPTVAGSDQLQRILLNLTLNARDAMPTGGRLSVATENVTLTDDQLAALIEPISPGDYVCLSVADTGGGMSEDVAARAFEPFFSTKPEADGTGLGLATTYGLVSQMEGGVGLETGPGGTTVSIYLPAAEQRSAAVSPEADRATFTGKGERILVVEDEEAVLALVTRILEGRGYEVIAARPEHAIEEATRSDQRIDLLITDIVMPGISGIDLAAALSSHRPHMPVVFMSGYSEKIILDNKLDSSERSLLSKPFTPAELLDIVGGALAQAPDLAAPGAA